MLRLVAGLIAPTRGTLEIDGTPVTEPRRDIGIVFQSPTLLPWATVAENVLFPLRLMREAGSDSRARAQSLLDLVGLAGFESRYPRELSGECSSAPRSAVRLSTTPPSCSWTSRSGPSTPSRAK